MRLPTYQWIGQMLAALAVTMSLALVAWELKQSRDLGRADLYQQSAAMIMEYQSNLLTSEPLRAATDKLSLEGPAQMSKEDILILLDFAEGWLMHLEVQFSQYQLGMISDAEWAMTQRIIARMVGTPCFIDYWKRSLSDSFRAGFVEEVDMILEGVPESACSL
jgi:hypothetical protein